MRRLVVAVGKRLLRRWLVLKGTSARPCVALTFDDGPDERFTVRVLNVLAAHDAKATFFLVGNRLAGNEGIADRIRREGHEIGNHSLTHPEFKSISLSSMHEQISRMDALIGAGPASKDKPWFRPPKGLISVRTMMYAVWHRRPYVLWSKDPKDFSAGSPDEISAYFEKSPPVAGDIVLLHDKSEATVQALESLLQRLRQQGLRPVTVSELLDA